MDWALVDERQSGSGAECLCVRPSLGRFELGICRWVPDAPPNYPSFVVSACVGDVHDIDPGCLVDAPDAGGSPMMRSFTLSQGGGYFQISGNITCPFHLDVGSISMALATIGWDGEASRVLAMLESPS